MKTGAKKKPMLMAAIKEEQHQAQLREAYGITEKGQGCREKIPNRADAPRTDQRRVRGRAVRGATCNRRSCIIGLATLIYPNMRAAALETWQEIMVQLADFLCK